MNWARTETGAGNRAGPGYGLCTTPLQIPRELPFAAQNPRSHKKTPPRVNSRWRFPHRGGPVASIPQRIGPRLIGLVTHRPAALETQAATICGTSVRGATASRRARPAPHLHRGGPRRPYCLRARSNAFLARAWYSSARGWSPRLSYCSASSWHRRACSGNGASARAASISSI